MIFATFLCLREKPRAASSSNPAEEGRSSLQARSSLLQSAVFDRDGKCHKHRCNLRRRNIEPVGRDIHHYVIGRKGRKQCLPRRRCRYP